MNKILKTLVVVAMAIFATSCADKFDDVNIASDGAVVSFSATMPELSRVISDGQTAEDLKIFVYQANNSKFLFKTEAKFENLIAKADLKLVQGMTYNVVFWAQSPEAPYTFDEQSATVEMNYSDYAGNNEDRDAFYTVEQIYVNGPDNRHVKLYRPFAQVNLGTNDLEDAHKAGYMPGIMVAELEAYPSMNLLTGEANGAAEAVSFKADSVEEIVSEEWPGSVKTYDWLSMNYILIGAERESINVRYTMGNAAGGSDIVVAESNVPVQRNYRTNLVGSVLTNNIGLIVEIIPAYEQPDYGLTLQEDGSWIVTSVNGLRQFADIVNGNASRAANNSFKGEIVKLGCDLDLMGQDWEPIGGNGHAFEGSFDGQNFTISNYKVNAAGFAGLFGKVFRGDVKNLSVENVEVVSNHYAGAIVGHGYIGVLDNCHASNVKVSVSIDKAANDFGDKAGAIIGYNGEGYYTISNCSVNGAYIEGYRDLGGIVGMANSNNAVKNCSVKNLAIVQVTEGGYQSSVPTTLGAIVGRQGSNVTLENNSEEGVTITDAPVAEGLADKVQVAGATIVLEAGEYELPTTFAEDVTIICEPGTVFNRPESKAISLDINGATIVGATFKGSSESGNLTNGTVNGTFKNCTFDGYNTMRYCYAGADELLFEGCTFKGKDYAVHFDSGSNKVLRFKDCKFYGTFTNGVGFEVIVENCEFHSDLRGYFNIPNFYDKSTVIDTDFVFDGTAVKKQSIRLHNASDDASKHVFTNCTVAGEPLADHLDYLAEKLSAGERITIDGVVYEYGNGLWIAGNKYQVFAKEGLMSFCNKSIDKDLYLTADIDLAGEAWVPAKLNGGKCFDGQGHTISNLTSINNLGYGNGLFSNVYGNASVKNLVIDGATVRRYDLGSNSYSGNAYGIVTGYLYGNGTFENITIRNSSVGGFGKVGAIVGFSADPGSYTVNFKNCVVENSVTIYGTYNVADLCGVYLEGVSIAHENCSLNGVWARDESCSYTTVNGNFYWVYNDTTYYAAYAKVATSYEVYEQDGITFVGKCYNE